MSERLVRTAQTLNAAYATNDAAAIPAELNAGVSKTALPRNG